MKIINSDCIEAMKQMADNSVDAIVTDPPYELGFMGKSWDSTGIAFNVEVWKEALRVLKPGANLIAFSGSRTYHRMAVAIEDAGFEIRDQIMWVYGSGFPKSMDISKAIDKAAGAERKIVGRNPNDRAQNSDIDFNGKGNGFITVPATEAAKQWEGWGTALKPAHEPMVLARKPIEGTVANNVLTYGVGGLNIDGSRIEGEVLSVPMAEWTRSGTTGSSDKRNGEMSQPHLSGRFPANFIHDGLETEWAKFFYCAKTSKADRNEGLDGFPTKQKIFNGQNDTSSDYVEGSVENKFTTQPSPNHHPTVKPTELMRYLCKLITPPSGVILDPFMGSGSTGKGAVKEGFDFIGIDQSSEYCEIARARIENASQTLPEFEQEQLL
jgi:DNA modification methylase